MRGLSSLLRPERPTMRLAAVLIACGSVVMAVGGIGSSESAGFFVGGEATRVVLSIGIFLIVCGVYTAGRAERQKPASKEE